MEKENDNKLIERHASACLRIQRRDDFARFADKERYRHGADRGEVNESHSFGRFIKRFILKKVGEAVGVTCQHIEAENKGYPKGFTNYDTFNPRYRMPRRKKRV